MSRQQLVLVLGASGYVGGRLVPRLLAAGHRVRCLVRSAGKVADRPWAGEVELVEGDLLDRGSLGSAFAGVDAVQHLAHPLWTAEGLARADRVIAGNVAAAAAAAGVRRIVHLGGLGQRRGTDVLSGGPVPTTILRAAMILGSGSASFEMLRHLVERLPLMVTPRWVHSRVQPIAVVDVLRYLVGVLDVEDSADHGYDIGGPDILTYLDMMRVYARVAGLAPRLVLTVPVRAPSLSSHWVHLVTPVPLGIARPLVSSLAGDLVVRPGGEDITAVVPGPCVPYAESVRLALARVRDAEVETSWREAEIAGRGPAEPFPGDPAWTGGTLLRDEQEVHVDAPAAAVFASVTGVGGARGWPTRMWAWRARGLIDRLVGGVGLRRGRRDPHELRVGDAVDFWRVEEVRMPARAAAAETGTGTGVLRLRAEMRLPGRAWLEWRIVPSSDRPGTLLRQRALFAPSGVLGRLYWWAMLPFHGFIFRSMAEALAADAVELAAGALTSSGAPTAPPAGRGARGGGPDPGPPPARRAG